MYSELNRIAFDKPAHALLLSKLADTDEDFTYTIVDGNKVRVDRRNILYTTSATFDAATKKVRGARCISG